MARGTMAELRGGRRPTIVGLLVVAIAAAAAAVRPTGAPAASRPAPSRPNVVWFISDDLSPHLGAYGDPVARTPTIDRLAAEGLRFETVYADAPVCAPSRFGLLTGLYSATAGPAHHMRATARVPSFVRGFPELLRRAGYYAVNNAKTDYNADVDLETTWDESSVRAHWRGRPDGVPFFAQFTTLTTHEASVFSHRPGQTRSEDVRVPPFRPDTPTARADAAQYYDRIAQMDGELAQRLAELEADGLADDTIVFYFSDNGGVLPWSKRFATDRGLRVPLIVRIPRKWARLAPAPSGSVVEGPVRFVDFAPTVLALAGVEIPRHMQGTPFLGRSPRPRRYAYGQRSRMDERYDLQRVVRDGRYLYVRNYMPHRPYGQHVGFMWNQRGYQEWERRHLDGQLEPFQDRFWNEKPSEELYDLRRDPDQLANLARAPTHGRVLRRLRQALDKHLVRIRDNGFIPEGSPPEGYAQSRARGAYPVRRVMRVAQRAIERDPRHLDGFVEHLSDANAVVRYWAVQGLVMLGDAAGAAAASLAHRLDADPSVHVRVAAAEALARLGDTGRPVAVLAGTLDRHEDPRVRLLAVNALTALPVAAVRPYRDVVERAARVPDEYVASGSRYLGALLDGTYDPRRPP